MRLIALFGTFLLLACGPSRPPGVTPNPDACTPETTEETCSRLHVCGVASVRDNCGSTFNVECPACDAGGDAGPPDAGPPCFPGTEMRDGGECYPLPDGGVGKTCQMDEDCGANAPHCVPSSSDGVTTLCAPACDQAAANRCPAGMVCLNSNLICH